ncbi:MAG: hypothetical protein QGH33_19995 [Pirellulaceae bacterium]|nr:hypothetical protein [Pirellulaceae bacterium]HJN12208.1 hypothetical protein [Pirellulaceae bacterium]
MLQRILIIAVVMGGGLPAMAQTPPSYLVLRSPHNTVHTVRRHQSRYVQPRGYETTVHRQTYAYGWFGVAPRRHWSRHTGYYGNYWQWSAR